METNISSEVKIFLSATFGVNGNIQYLISKLMLPAGRWCRSDQRGNWAFASHSPSDPITWSQDVTGRSYKRAGPGTWMVWGLLTMPFPFTTHFNVHMARVDSAPAFEASQHMRWLSHKEHWLCLGCSSVSQTEWLSFQPYPAPSSRQV